MQQLSGLQVYEKYQIGILKEGCYSPAMLYCGGCITYSRSHFYNLKS